MDVYRDRGADRIMVQRGRYLDHKEWDANCRGDRKSKTVIRSLSPERRRKKSGETAHELLDELRERRRALDARSIDYDRCQQRERAASDVRTTLAQLKALGISGDRLAELEALHALGEPDELLHSLRVAWNRKNTFDHADFNNPEAQSCWLSTFFQSLWHSRVFHAAFDRIVRPLPSTSGSTVLRALRKTWELYEGAAARGDVVPVRELVCALGDGYGDCGDAFATLHGEPCLEPLANMFALVPIHVTDHAPRPPEIWEHVVEMGVRAAPLLAVDFSLEYLSDDSLGTLTLAFVPPSSNGADLGDEHKLVAMICFMQAYAHYVVFCRRVSDEARWLLFNDLPRLTPGARAELRDWAGVAHECARFHLHPKVLLYESPAAAERAARQATPAFWRRMASAMTRRRHQNGPGKLTRGHWLGGLGCCLLGVAAAMLVQWHVPLASVLFAFQ